MTIYNLMTMDGFGSGFQVTWIASWLSLMIVFFLAFILRKQCDDGFLSGTNYNVWGAMAIGLIVDVAIITFTGAPAWALLGGLAGVAAGGFGIGLIAPSESSSE